MFDLTTKSTPLGVVRIVLLVCAYASLTQTPRPAYGQVLYGSLTGTVTDRSGAVVPGANVTSLQTQTGVSRRHWRIRAASIDSRRFWVGRTR